jgi:hypothetical protein
MAYIKFCVVAVETDLKESSIYIHFNKQVDTDTVNASNITVALRDNTVSTLSYFDLVVSDDLKTITIKFKDTPVVNSDYVIVIQNTLVDLEGNQLDKSLFRSVVFKSTVTSDISLVSPANFEILNTKKFVWTEEGDSPVNSYRIQISDDTGFHNLLIDSIVVGQNDVTFGKELRNGQYYYRIRAELGDDYGTWSEIRTFLIQSDSEYEEEPIAEDSTVETEIGEPTFENLVTEERIDLIGLIEGPKSGVTPSSFSFLFDEDIDISNIKVSIVRSDF